MVAVMTGLVAYVVPMPFIMISMFSGVVQAFVFSLLSVQYMAGIVTGSEVVSETEPKLAPATMAVLTSYPWPGNVRQLRNLIEWLIIMHPGKTVEADMLPSELKHGEIEENGTLMTQVVSMPLREAREMFEKNYLCEQLKRFSGNISRTADFVGMERSALHRKLKTLGLESRDA